jgi:hypothetical protein
VPDPDKVPDGVKLLPLESPIVLDEFQQVSVDPLREYTSISPFGPVVVVPLGTPDMLNSDLAVIGSRMVYEEPDPNHKYGRTPFSLRLLISNSWPNARFVTPSRYQTSSPVYRSMQRVPQTVEPSGERSVKIISPLMTMGI